MREFCEQYGRKKDRCSYSSRPRADFGIVSLVKRVLIAVLETEASGDSMNAPMASTSSH